MHSQRIQHQYMHTFGRLTVEFYTLSQPFNQWSDCSTSMVGLRSDGWLGPRPIYLSGAAAVTARGGTGACCGVAAHSWVQTPFLKSNSPAHHGQVHLELCFYRPLTQLAHPQ